VKQLLVIEDGDEYAEFARLFLSRDFAVRAAGSAAEALAAIDQHGADALLIDLRFDRAPPEALVGDLEGTAARLFAGDRARAERYLQDQQGALILAALRAAGHMQRAVFVHDFPPRRLENLRRMYGRVEAVAAFDAAALRRLLGAP
jgi:ActR/RegA family two-component response regulator